MEDPRVAALEQQLAECQRALLEGRQLRLSERARARDAAEREHAGEVEAASASAALAAHELAAAAHAECESLRAALRDAEATIAVQRGVLSEVVARERVVVSTLGADVRSLERRLASARAHAIRGATLLQQRVDKSEREAAHAVKVAQRAAKHAAKSGHMPTLSFTSWPSCSISRRTMVACPTAHATASGVLQRFFHCPSARHCLRAGNGAGRGSLTRRCER